MRLPKLNRKGKTFRNLVLAALVLFLTAGMLDFPCWTKMGLLRRAEREYLLTEGAELLYDSRSDPVGPDTLYARSGEQLLEIGYEQTPLGLRTVSITLYPPDAWYTLDFRWRYRSEGGAHQPGGKLVGFVEHVAIAELEIAWRLHDAQGTLLIQGERQAPCCFTFRIQEPPGGFSEAEERFLTGQEVPRLTGTLRLYGANGSLLAEQVYPDLW